VTFNFQGKSGVEHTIDLQDRRLARIVERCRDLPGYELFQYLDNEGNRHSIDAADVNDYLREISGDDFTAKDFRTWAGTVLACEMLRQFEPAESNTQAKKNVVAAIKSVSERLGNTPSVCRKCYVHPAVLETYLGGAMMQAFEDEVQREVDKQLKALRQEELDVLHLLESRLKKAA
jgi:DNA topoisomerase-1